MRNFWLHPEGYQRTSRNVQRKCLDRLLGFGSNHGKILDVGCGTANTLQILSHSDFSSYLGIDISSDMIDFAKTNHQGEKIRFETADFLEWKRRNNEFFDTVICAACLHWFIPNEHLVIAKIYEALADAGSLYLSCAANFDFLSGERELQAETLSLIRKNRHVTTRPIVFDDFRFSPKKIITLLEKFDLKIIHKIEEKIALRNFNDFRDWHLGSGSVIYRQFAPRDRDGAVKEYYEKLYDLYRSVSQDVSYSTMLMHLKKRK